MTGYLRELGITHAYTSSYLTAVPGSTHGYDVADPTAINPELGGRDGFDAWVRDLRAHGLGHVLDIVPNHMGIAHGANPWWQDVLENGPSSPHAAVFDIDWTPVQEKLQQRVLLPILGDRYGSVLERGELVLAYARGAFSVRYFDHVLPVAPGTYAQLLEPDQALLLDQVGAQSEEAVEFLSILTAVHRLPGRDVHEPELVEERQREKEVIKRRLDALVTRSTAVREYLEAVVTRINGRVGDPMSFDRLDRLLASQAYRVAYWRVAAEEINYRRFFDVNELVATRMEDDAVFEPSHRLVLALVEGGQVDGLRIDHVDGLYDPAAYLARLRSRVDRPGASCYIVVEKILTGDEPLPDWPVEGTTGYEFLRWTDGLFVDPAGERALTTAYDRFVRQRQTLEEVEYRSRALILDTSMVSELHALGHQLYELSDATRHFRDFTLNSLIQALGEVIACFPVYRTYLQADPEGPSERDRAVVERAVRVAKARNPGSPGVVFDFVRSILLDPEGALPEADPAAVRRFVGKFQQVTSPVAAKGVEDTAFYRYLRLVSLNEVGGDPGRFGVAPEALHRWLAARQEKWPGGLSTTSTHDTKRSEDVRARIHVLSETPDAWRRALSRWSRANRRHLTRLEDERAPSRAEEYLLYQTLLGTWPSEPMSADAERAYTARIVEYLRKAIREAKITSSWLNPDEAHEAAVERFVTRVLDPGHSAFRDDFLQVLMPVVRAGAVNALAQLVLKMCAPGVPDLYQGSELWNLCLVDPDNRRPVDYARRQDLLQALDAAITREGRQAVAARLANRLTEDRTKLFVTTTLLRCRHANAALFRHGRYTPVATTGPAAPHLFAFARHDARDAVLVAVPRLLASAYRDGSRPDTDALWAETTLEVQGVPPGRYRNLFTDTVIDLSDAAEAWSLPAAEAFDSFPVTVLQREA